MGETEKMMEVYNILMLLTPVTNKMDSVAFGSFYCTLLEEWCLANDQDVISYIQLFAEQIKALNEEWGSY